jgi:hypothetical protein
MTHAILQEEVTTICWGEASLASFSPTAAASSDDATNLSSVDTTCNIEAGDVDENTAVSQIGNSFLTKLLVLLLVTVDMSLNSSCSRGSTTPDGPFMTVVGPLFNRIERMRHANGFKINNQSKF